MAVSSLHLNQRRHQRSRGERQLVERSGAERATTSSRSLIRASAAAAYGFVETFGTVHNHLFIYVCACVCVFVWEYPTTELGHPWKHTFPYRGAAWLYTAGRILRKQVCTPLNKQGVINSSLSLPSITRRRPWRTIPQRRHSQVTAFNVMTRSRLFCQKRMWQIVAVYKTVLRRRSASSHRVHKYAKCINMRSDAKCFGNLLVTFRHYLDELVARAFIRYKL